MNTINTIVFLQFIQNVIIFYVCIVKILQDFECQFPNAKDRFIAAFEANIVPAALKLAGTSKNDNIRLMSLLPTGATSG
jgi:hypothetical protein